MMPCQLHVPLDDAPSSLLPSIREEEESENPEHTHRRVERQKRRQRDQDDLEDFLAKHQFPDVNMRQRKQRSHRCGRLTCLFPEQEELYPIHAAAMEGNLKMVVLLVRAGANREQETSRGRTASELVEQSMRQDAADGASVSRVVNSRRIEILQVLEGT
ncbi:unnamed protein product [Durusdinium trenchii]|uniref:Uncharacterized protein n=1 Tax=Durusdinium trenchii TaxID=1381693 RepID=A0ABP0P0K6_9DINO